MKSTVSIPDRHADAEDDACERLRRLALAVGEHQAADHDGDETARVGMPEPEGRF